MDTFSDSRGRPVGASHPISSPCAHMPLDLLIVPHASGPSSFVQVDSTSYPEWLAAKAPTGYDRHALQKVFSYVRRDMNDGTKGSDFRTGFYAELTRSVSAFVKDYLRTHLGFTISDPQVQTVVATVPLTLLGVESLRNQTAKQVKELNNVKKSNIDVQAATWANRVRDAAICWWVTSVKLPTFTAPTERETDTAVRDSAGVSCAVHVYDGSAWSQVGTRTEAAPKATGPNHAEMKWKDEHGDTLEAEMYSVTRVDFHITEQPCGQYCAERMMRWWKDLDTGTVEGYVVTYKEQDGAGYVYRLQENMILRLT